MARYISRWIGRKKSAQKASRRTSLRRRLRSEFLENRQLLAGDFFHNEFMPEDVNNDGDVSARDALAIINAMNREATGGEASGDNTLFTDVNNDGRRSSRDALMVINRLGRDDAQRRDRPRPDQNDSDQGNADLGNADQGDANQDDPSPTGEQPDAVEARSIDGTGNNIDNVDFGASGIPLLRVADADYADGISAPAGADRPSAREISNTLSAAGDTSVLSERNLSNFLYIWGQFLDHDIDLSHAPSEETSQERFDIAVPTGDPHFDPFGSGVATIPLTRSEIDPSSGTSLDNPAQQVNSITAWIDGSQVYGSDDATAAALREFQGGRMLISDEGLVPTDENGSLLAGDIRAAENLALTSMHALFLREHNRIADQVATEHPELSDEEVFQEARRVVIAELQAITYNEFLPALLGRDALTRYEGYDASVNPGIANEFSTAAFRFGHSTLNDEIDFVGNDGLDVQDAVTLAEAFFNPAMLEETGIDSVLKAGASNVSQEIDLEIVDSLRNFLFGPPGAGGLDLASLNIQRGRDHGLADYNSTRAAYGLDTYHSFDEITRDVELQANLESLYGDVNNIDLWVGLLAEDHVAGASVGELTRTIISDQFQRLRDGDRFWYQNTMRGRQLERVHNVTLADIIQRNTNVDGLQDNVFVFQPVISGSVTTTGDGALPEALTDAALTDAALTDMMRDDNAARSGDTRRGGDRPARPQAIPMEGMTVELLDDNGNVIASTETDENGRYRFDAIPETGMFHVRLADDNGADVVGESTLDALVRSGNYRLNDMDFRVV